MDRNGGIIRWSPHQSRDEFIKINLNNRVISLYEATGYARPGKFDYLRVSRHTNFPTISGYDWSPIVRGLVGIGTPQGEVRLLRLDDNSNAYLSLSLSLPRTCQAVAFNTTGLLAVGLDRVRHDAGLQIWDVNQRLADWNCSKPGWTVPGSTCEPMRKLDGSMSVTSVRFFEDTPQTLIFGVRNQALKICDLRDPNFTSISFPTRCNFNIAIDHLDTNYFASSTLDLPGLVIFDKRASSDRTNVAPRYIEAFEEEKLPWGAVLKLDRIIEGDKSISVKQLRFSREHSGALGVLSTSGQLQVLQTKKECVGPKSEVNTRSSPELLEIKRSYELERSRQNFSNKKTFEQRIVSFDWIYLRTLDLEPRIIGLQANGEFRIFQMPSTTSAHLLQMIPWSQPHELDDSFLEIPKYEDPKQRQESLGPLYANLAKFDIPIFGHNRYGTIKTRNDLASKIKSSIQSDDKKIISHRFFNLNKFEEIDMIGLARVGYLFDCQKNKLLVGNNMHLQDLWEWVSGAEKAAKEDGMLTGPLDLSYMGIYYVWTNQLGKKTKSRLISCAANPEPSQWEYLIAKLNKKKNRTSFDNVKTSKPHHRILCLAICGCYKTEAEVLEEIEALLATGDHAQAACIALLEELPELSITILKESGNEYLFLAMALDLKIKTKISSLLPESDWKKALDHDQSLSTNAYIRAIYRYISTGSWEAVSEEKRLPLRRRLALALRKFTDDKLTDWLEKEMQELTKNGNIEGIVLAGITDSIVPILSKYVEISGDFQTAILVLSFCYPRYIDEIQCDAWRDAYRFFLNRHKRFIERVKFDQGSIKKSQNRDGVTILKPSPRQVTIRCLNCDKMTANDLVHSNPSATMALDSSLNPLTIAGINAGLKCPHCGAGLPRCVVCLHHVLGQTRSYRQELSRDLSNSKPTTNFPCFCMKCKHVMHLDHAMLWFSKHVECPVPECYCRCNDMASR
ncbi:hypothetical protein Golomagni_03632 [Golovinomyces magnicellulatus]|nr:hypothetical protein Golomagni_03632 [Golovinomyces magnicellulatus]